MKRHSSEIDDSNQSNSANRQKKVWVKDRSKDWWKSMNEPECPDSTFIEAFRMSKGTFQMFCSELEPRIMKKNTVLRDAIPVRQRVAVCLWRLATGSSLRKISAKFGLGTMTCHKFVVEVCDAIKSLLMPKFIKWPDRDRMEEIMRRFENSSKIPNVVGALYRTHVHIIQPRVNPTAYLNKFHTEMSKKKSYSVTVQGVVDNNGLFTDVCIGFPGSMTDEQVLEKSSLQKKAAVQHTTDAWIVGSSNYALKEWMLVPYTTPKNKAEIMYNEKHNEISGVAKEAFVRMKARWRYLIKRPEINVQELGVLLGACCALHNLCETMGEEFSSELTTNEVQIDEGSTVNFTLATNAQRLRDNIVQNVFEPLIHRKELKKKKELQRSHHNLHQ